ncbi:MAG TPA: hypothetical protein VFV48_04185 [Pseudomonadales bacterium]|nr:hypothetical protein [Pseudomonadales bacterium]
MTLRKSLAAGALALMLPLSAMAATDFKINGFTTIQMGATDTDQTYVATNKDLGFSEGTLLGLQMRFAPNNQVPISFVTQLLARAQDDWKLNADWAFVNWKVNDEFNVNVGRIKLPLFIISEAYDVGLTYPWIRPPEELYGFGNVPLTALTGMSFDYRKYFDDNWVRAQIYTGRDVLSAPALGTVIGGDIKTMYGMVLSAGTENLEVRAGAAELTINMTLRSDILSLPAAKQMQADIGTSVVQATAALTGANAVVDGIEAQINAAGGINNPAAAVYIPAYQSALTDMQVAGASLQTAAANASAAEAIFAQIPDDGDAKFKSVGARYDNGTLMFITEVGDRTIGGLPFADTLAGFATFGMHMGKFLPHFTYSAVQAEHSDLSNQSQESYILGMRYDVQPWAALKMEYQYTKLGDANLRSAGSPLINPNISATQYVQSMGLFNVVPDLTTFKADVPDKLNKVSLALNIVF